MVNRFRALVEHSADAIWMVGESGRIEYASPASRVVLGYTPEELAGADAFDFFLPSDREAARARLFDPQGGSAPFRLRRKDGQVIWAHAAGANRLADPQVGAVIVSLRDVTEARRAEQALRDSESRFRALVENSTDGFVLLDRAGTVVYSGPPVLGYVENAFVGRSVLEVIHPDDLMRVCADLAAVAAVPAKRVTNEYRVRHADGGWRWVEVGMKNLLSDPAVSGIVVNYRDISARRRHEEELRKARDQVQRILESIRESFLALDREWRFTYVNRNVADAIGGTPEETIGRNLWEVFPEARDTELYPNYQRVMTDRVPVQFEMYYPPTGRWLDVHAYPTDEGLSAYVLDITARKRAERRASARHEVTRALLEAADLDEAVSRIQRGLGEALGCPAGTFWIADEPRGMLRAAKPRRGRPKSLRKGEGLPGLAWETDRAAHSSAEGASGFAFPVRRGARVVGVLEFSSPEPRDADSELVDLLDAIAQQIGQALER